MNSAKGRYKKKTDGKLAGDREKKKQQAKSRRVNCSGDRQGRDKNGGIEWESREEGKRGN